MKLIIIIALLIGVIIVGPLYQVLPSKWDTKSRLIVAIPKDSGDVVISIFDPASHSIMYFTLPGATQVTASRSLGLWKLGSIWQLGLQEKLGGRLLTETILKSFQIPTDAWAEPRALGLLSSNLGEIFKAGIGVGNTNLTLKDRISLAFFSLRLNPSDKYEVNLIENGYLYETTLVDGDAGYAHKKVLPSKIISYVSDPAMSVHQPRVTISDAAGPSSAAMQVSQVVETLGGKVLSIKDEKEIEDDCLINTTSASVAKRIAELLGCRVTKDAPSGNFDIEIVIGSAFAKRF